MHWRLSRTYIRRTRRACSTTPHTANPPRLLQLPFFSRVCRLFRLKAGWGGGGGDGGGGGGVGGRATDKNVELGGVVMLHDDMVAADREQELPPGTQESINEVQMMVSVEARDVRMTLAYPSLRSKSPALEVIGDVNGEGGQLEGGNRSEMHQLMLRRGEGGATVL